MEEYDRTMIEFYASQGMHEGDQRWTTVMAGRTGQFHDRAELDEFLTAQGFRLRR